MSCETSSEAMPDKPYHHIKGGFRNPPDSIGRDSRLTMRIKFFWEFLTHKEDAVIDKTHYIDASQARSDFLQMQDRDVLSWIGHATFFARLDGVTILTDPIFSTRASPVSFAGPKRFMPPGIALTDLPPIDVVIISHAHYDHLDVDTLDALANKQNITAIVPLGLASYFTKRGFGTVHEVDWYDTVYVKGIKFTAYPAVHWANRTPFDVNETLWMSYAFSSDTISIYHSGDTETHTSLFKDIGRHMAEHHNGCDIGLMSAGAYEPRVMMRGAHMTPEGGTQAGKDLNCSTLVPMHWGTFPLSLEPFYEPRERFSKAAQNQAYIMRIGESLLLDKPARP